MLFPPLVARVELFARVSVPVVEVTVSPFNEVAVATPKVGVVNVGLVNVLLVSVSVPALVAKVPLVGSVTLESAELVSVILCAPLVASVELLARVSVPVVVVIVNPLMVVPVMVPAVMTEFFQRLLTVTFLSAPESQSGSSSVPAKVVLAGWSSMVPAAGRMLAEASRR
jgi:hypothetical protein